MGTNASDTGQRGATVAFFDVINRLIDQMLLVVEGCCGCALSQSQTETGQCGRGTRNYSPLRNCRSYRNSAEMSVETPNTYEDIGDNSRGSPSRSWEAKQEELRHGLKHSGSEKEALLLQHEHCSGDDDDVCPTCLEMYGLQNPRVQTRCGHHFHLQCIYSWHERSPLCPICGKKMEIEALS